MLKDKILRISLIFIAALIIVGIVTINFIIKDSSQPTYTSSPKTQKVTNVSTDTKELSLDTIFITIRSDKYRILKADFAFKMKRESDRKTPSRSWPPGTERAGGWF